ncbi:MAG: pyridine nucleotide-disulfide oxidoreductase/dicluster-binding protein [Desulfovibrio sp.]|uniref:pyridine nucleotide-disulfide oxidoreductase/dicluster-binding protein n=1 Tax=Desulfovibrio sp. 7SRBS1 TaxID=3378064 RepID=UPI003B3DC16D
MDQRELRAWEAKCIQEEPAACKAACPLHVDVRAFTRALAVGSAANARKVLEKTLPLAGITARLCEGPCRNACLRGDLGGAIQVPLLERTCVEKARRVGKPLRLPSRGKNALVVGDAPSGFCVAFDLGKKGYNITLLHTGENIGGWLRSVPEDKLPASVLDEEVALLKGMGIRYEQVASLEDGLLAEREYDAAYICQDAELAPSLQISSEDVDSLTLAWNREKIFTGGFSGSTGERRFIDDVADGRRAATSMDRLMQGASLTAERRREGPFETRLFTSLQDVQFAPQDPALTTLRICNDDQAKAEAARCIQCECMECVKSCAYLEKYKAYPKVYVRQIYNNEAIVKGTHQANTMINSCSLCGLCETVCPEDFSMADLCLTSRRGMVKESRMPPSAHDFALQEMRTSLDDAYFGAHHAPGTTSSEWVYFPGCQLAGMGPDKVMASWQYLRDELSGGNGSVGIFLGCCGIPAHWAARDEEFASVLDKLRTAWTDLGKPKVVTACSSCLSVFSEYCPEFQAVSLWEVMEKHDLPDGCAPLGEAPLAVTDPCTTRHVPAVRQAVRNILDRLKQPVEDLRKSGENTECCGFGGLQENANPDLADDIIARRAGQSENDFLAYCAMCRDRLASTGKRTVHLLDMLFPDAKIDDPALVPAAGLNERREGRMWLRRELASQFGDEQAAAREWDGIELLVTADVRLLLEKRRILDDDLRRVLFEVGKTGREFRHVEGRSMACARLGEVTYWLEYEREGESYRVFRAWSHRMKVEGV